MLRTISLTIAGLVLIPSNPAVAQKKPISNKIALAAKKDYDVAIARAKKEYAAKLKLAIKDAGGKGDLEEANRLAAEKKRVDNGDNDPFTAFRRRLIGTKWNSSPTVPKSWNLFERNHFGSSHDREQFRWFVTSKNTLIQQNTKRVKNIYVWHFDDNLKTATLHQFSKTSVVITGRRVP